jgi:hypothetical protein
MRRLIFVMIATLAMTLTLAAPVHPRPFGPDE